MGLMMRASSPEDEEIERPDCYVYRLPTSPPTVTELKLQPWPTRTESSTADVISSSSHMLAISQSPTATPQNNQKTTNSLSPPCESPTPKSPPKPFRIAKRRHRSKSNSHHPSMKAHARFTSSNFSKAGNLALEIQNEIEHSRTKDLRLGRERSTWYWFCKRTFEPQPNEMLRKLRRLQFEVSKRELLANGIKDWEISALCLEGGSGLRKEIKLEEI
ncbi:hypothetical protein BKA64DRAFT_702400 [Cadophora sp. MPI-SDFR-AT-0126]|nr:hypothetical protein BKA64DRAFT_702400 [Leotiomycetes sp. MPI-SDFR-AT-0126]